MSSESKAFREGYEARCSKVPEDEGNPYDYNTTEAIEWVTGWNACDAEMAQPDLDDFE